MTDSQATLRAQQRSAAATVARYILELATPSTASGPDQGSVRVIPNGARTADAAP
jgi:hypothetical protein